MNKVEIICTEHGPFLITPNHHLNGQGCPSCRYIKIALKQKDTKEKFVKKAEKIHGIKCDYTSTVYTNQASDIIVRCTLHDIIFTTNAGAHLQRKELTGCPSCGKESLKEKNSWTSTDFINKSNFIHDNKYDYTKSNYTGALNQISITCPKHGPFSQQAFSHMRGVGCPHCNESKGERMISKILDNLNLTYVRQHKFDGCRHKYRLRFDFYLPNHNCCIEFDGRQHREPVHQFGGKTALLEQKQRDLIKTEYCINNGIQLIRVSHRDSDPEIFIRQKLNI